MKLKPAFRHKTTGEVVETQGFHDVEDPRVCDNCDDWEDGWASEEGKFHTREEAQKAHNLPSVKKDSLTKSIDDALNEFTQQLKELSSAESLNKALIIPHTHTTGLDVGSGVEDVPPGKVKTLSKVSPPGKAKQVESIKAKLKAKGVSKEKAANIAFGTAWKQADVKKEAKSMASEKCSKCGQLMSPVEKSELAKASIVYSPDTKMFVQGVNPDSAPPPDLKNIKEISAEGSGGKITKGPKLLRAKAMAKAALSMNKSEDHASGWKEWSDHNHSKQIGDHKYDIQRMTTSRNEPKKFALTHIVNKEPVEIGQHDSLEGAQKAAHAHAAKLGKDEIHQTTMQPIAPNGSTEDKKEIAKAAPDTWKPEAPAAPEAAPAAPSEGKKPQYTGKDLQAAKAKMMNAGVEPRKHGIFGRLSKFK